MLNKINQVKAGIVISYLFIIINALYTIVITPFLIGCLGDSEYGVYKTISSLTATLIVVDLGIGGTVQRYTAKYLADKEEHKVSNFLAMNYLQATLLVIVLIIVGLVLFFGIEPTYGNSFSENQIKIAKQIFIIMLLSMAIQFYGDVVNGVIVGYNQFFFGNGIKLVKILARIACIYFFLIRYRSAITLALIDFSLSIFTFVAQLLYVNRKLHIRTRLEKWDKSVFIEAGKYTFLMFLTTIVSQINSNVDNVIIGAISGPDLVTVYSIGLLFFGVFQSLSSAVSGVMLPTITNALVSENSQDKVVDIVIKAGRLQFIILGACFVGFICVGKDFINVWLGNKYSDVYIITIILVGPSLFELCINVCLSILRAKNRLVFRTLALSICTLLNVVITVIAVKYWSYIGAAIGTATSYIVCSLIAMNIYYSKIIKLPMMQIYKNICKRLFPCLIISGCVLYVVSRFLNGSYLNIFICGLIFLVVYSLTLYKFGFTNSEKAFFGLR